MRRNVKTGLQFRLKREMRHEKWCKRKKVDDFREDKVGKQVYL